MLDRVLDGFFDRVRVMRRHAASIPIRFDRWIVAGGVVLAFVALGARSSSGSPRDPLRIGVSPNDDAERGPAELHREACPENAVPADGICVTPTEGDEGVSAPALANTHREKSGRLATYEQIPRLPDRPPSYDAYRYPVPPGLPGGHYVVSGYDLDRPDVEQRRGRTLRHVGHGGVDIPQARGTPIKLVALEHQEGEAEVLYTGALFGTTVLTRHTVREGGRLRDYVVLFGHLDAIAAGIAPGILLKEGDLVGAVGDSSSPGLVHLHLEIRRVREGVDVSKVPAGPPMIGEMVSTVCDPRNVLPLAP